MQGRIEARIRSAQLNLCLGVRMLWYVLNRRVTFDVKTKRVSRPAVVCPVDQHLAGSSKDSGLLHRAGGWVVLVCHFELVTFRHDN